MVMRIPGSKKNNQKKNRQTQAVSLAAVAEMLASQRSGCIRGKS